MLGNLPFLVLSIFQTKRSFSSQLLHFSLVNARRAAGVSRGGDAKQVFFLSRICPLHACDRSQTSCWREKRLVGLYRLGELRGRSENFAIGGGNREENYEERILGKFPSRRKSLSEPRCCSGDFSEDRASPFFQNFPRCFSFSIR